MTTQAPLTDAELKNIRCMLWLADVGHPPTLAKTIARLIATIDDLKSRLSAEDVRDRALEEALNDARQYMQEDENIEAFEDEYHEAVKHLKLILSVCKPVKSPTSSHKRDED